MKKPARIALTITWFACALAVLVLAVYLGTHGNVLASIPLLLIAGGFGWISGHDIQALSRGE